MDENQLHRLRYALKQCEKSYRDACDNPRNWEQARSNADGLLEQLPHLPEAERADWEARLQAWLPEIQAGARRLVGERVLRRIRDSLDRAAAQLADDADPSRELDWLARELADPSTIECVDAADLDDATGRLAALQAEFDRKVVEHRLAQAADRLSQAEARLAELEARVTDPEATVDHHLARVVAGDLDSAQAQIDDLPVDDDAGDEAGAARERLVAQLQRLRERYDAL